MNEWCDGPQTGLVATTNDGCPVEVYTFLPPAGEAEIVHAAVPAGAAVLDLGCGAGRIAHRLAELGHPVTAVDDSREMLAHVRGVEVVCSRIEDLRLARRFEVVLLASHLINMPDCQALLATVRHHLSDQGIAMIECYPPGWFDTVTDGPRGVSGEVEISLSGIVRSGDLLRAKVRYRVRGKHWDQPFTARRLGEPELREELARAGLTFGRWWSLERGWFAAMVANPPRCAYSV